MEFRNEDDAPNRPRESVSGHCNFFGNMTARCEKEKQDLQNNFMSFMLVVLVIKAIEISFQDCGGC